MFLFSIVHVEPSSGGQPLISHPCDERRRCSTQLFHHAFFHRREPGHLGKGGWHEGIRIYGFPGQPEFVEETIER